MGKASEPSSHVSVLGATSTAPIFTCFSGAASVGTLRKLGRFTSWEVSSSPAELVVRWDPNLGTETCSAVEIDGFAIRNIRQCFAGY
jgi:hypothetical protein